MRTAFIILFLIFTKVVVLANVDSLRVTVFFDHDSIEISSNEYDRLKLSVKEIDPTKVSVIIIKAYCDDTGHKLYNESLSKKRAFHVESVLKEIFQLKDSILFEIYGLGSLPIDSSKSVPPLEQRAGNRRAEIVIKNKIDSIIHVQNTEENIDIFQRDLDVGERAELRNIHFVAGRSKFLSQSYADLNMLLKFLSENKNYHIKIVGHIQYKENNRYNLPNKESKDLDTGQPLSVERAKAVFNFLIQNGIAAGRITYEGQGGLHPTEKGGAFDRRVEVVVIKK